MSFAEIKEEVARLSDAELEELAGCVRRARDARDPGWVERLARINDAMDQGHTHSKEEFLRVHEQLEREGR